MEFNVLTLFPKMIEDSLNHSILKRAMDKNIININAIDIRDFSKNKRKQADDYTYGDGAGMLIKPEPVYDAYMSIPKEKRENARVIYMSPQGKTFNQKMAMDLSKFENIVILCGHYEGIDERVLEEIVTDEISIGDYVLTGGELAACVIIDAVSRLIPEVLNKKESFETETFSENLVEYPQYTRPFEFMGKKVPEVLISGNHTEIEKWHRQKSIERTLKKRPELLSKAILSYEERKFVKNSKNDKMIKIIDKVSETCDFRFSDVMFLLENRNSDIQEYIAKKARNISEKIFGKKIYVRGLIEISSRCKNGCYYCGINKNNRNAQRYRLSEEEIINCAITGEKLGLKTFVLQGGEDSFFTDDILENIIKEIKKNTNNCAVTLSVGERSRESYKRLYDAGADRFLLRHETATQSHYNLLHPPKMFFENRMECLKNLKEIGFQTGCGFMVGSPYQTNENIVEDLRFIKEFEPHMVGIGPFISHKDTVFRDFENGNVELTLFLLSFIRILQPNVLLPATTALGTLDKKGREKGILAGANVLMPNLSPENVRSKYSLYDNKVYSGAEAAESIQILKDKMSVIGYEIISDRGDYSKRLI